MFIIKRFDKHFKEEAIRIVLEQKRPASAVAKELGIHVHTL
ncbi:MAG: transposase [Peptococcaceae bacterium]|nr:transposase [Peptococcaceae bacterium]